MRPCCGESAPHRTASPRTARLCRSGPRGCSAGRAELSVSTALTEPRSSRSARSYERRPGRPGRGGGKRRENEARRGRSRAARRTARAPPAPRPPEPLPAPGPAAPRLRPDPAPRRAPLTCWAAPLRTPHLRTPPSSLRRRGRAGLGGGGRRVKGAAASGARGAAPPPPGVTAERPRETRGPRVAAPGTAARCRGPGERSGFGSEMGVGVALSRTAPWLRAAAARFVSAASR